MWPTVVAPSVDLFAHLRPTQVSVNVGGKPFVLTASTAAQWLGAIALDPEGLYGIVPGLVGDDDLETMARLMTTHPDIEDRWFYAARTALGRAAGRDWWWALNLSRKALSAWIYINGILLRQGIRASQMSYPDWLDACYTMLWQGGDEKTQTQLDISLSAKPAGIPVKQSSQAVKEMLNAFAAD